MVLVFLLKTTTVVCNLIIVSREVARTLESYPKKPRLRASIRGIEGQRLARMRALGTVCRSDLYQPPTMQVSPAASGLDEGLLLL